MAMLISEILKPRQRRVLGKCLYIFKTYHKRPHPKTKYLFDIPLYICYIYSMLCYRLKKIQKTEQSADTINSQNQNVTLPLVTFLHSEKYQKKRL